MLFRITVSFKPLNRSKINSLCTLTLLGLAGCGPGQTAALLQAENSGRLALGQALVSSQATPGQSYSWVGILGTGQSLSVGGGAGPTPNSGGTNPRYANIKLYDSTGVYNTSNPAAASLTVATLKELIRPIPSPGPAAGGYPRNIYGETPHTAMAEQISEFARLDNRGYTTAHSVVGQSGMGIEFISAPTSWTPDYTQPYPASMYEAKALKNLAQKAGKSFGYGAVILTHGEHDAANSGYETAVVNLWRRYNTDLKAITGQTQDIPMILSQQNSGPNYTLDPNGKSVPPRFAYSTQAQWLAGVHNPGKIIVSGPKYQYSYSDGTHMNNTSYELAGEKYAEAFYATVEKGTPWVPLQPRAVQWTTGTNTITLSFDIPKTPLQWDTSMTVHQTANTYWQNGRGFEVLSADNIPLTIVAADLVNNNTGVRLTLGSSPLIGPLTVQYAMTQDGKEPNKSYAGSSLGRRGQLRDSDPFVGFTTGQRQPNYCLAFSLRTGNPSTPNTQVHSVVSNGWVKDFGPFNLVAGQTLTQKIDPNAGVTHKITSEIWDSTKSTRLCTVANIGANTCTYKATAAITVYARSYDGYAGDPYTATITVSNAGGTAPEIYHPVSNGWVIDYGPYNLMTGQTLIQRVDPDAGVTNKITSEIWDSKKTTRLCTVANAGSNTCTYKATAPTTVYARSYDGSSGDHYTVTITQSN